VNSTDAFAGIFAVPGDADATTNEDEIDEPESTFNTTEDTIGGAERNETVEAGYYDDYDWAELPPHIQEAAATLGYGQELWDARDGGAAWSEDYRWDELSPKARETAALLGYDEKSWDARKEAEDNAAGSRRRILYLFGSTSFVFVGALDLVREGRWFHLSMVFAGVFGVVSAVYIGGDGHIWGAPLSDVFRCVSFHMFLLEAVLSSCDETGYRAFLTGVRAGWMRCLVFLGELEFASGALVGVIVRDFAYISLFTL